MFNIGTLSRSKSKSEQSADVFLTQQFSGSCNIVCQNTMSEVSIDLINTNVGGDVSITQACSTNGTCMIGSSMDSTMDVLFKAANSSNANPAGSGVSTIGGVTLSSSKSRQDMRLSSYQNTNESCNIGSYNQMNNVSIFAANSNIGGSVDISQDATTGGNCSLSNSMSAAASATGLSENESSSGKGGKKGGKKAGIMNFIIIMAILLVAFFIAKSIAGNSQGNEQKRTDMELAMARAQAGCPGGGQPIINPKTGLPYIDTKTMRPICPYPTINKPSTNMTGSTAPTKSGGNIPPSTFQGNIPSK